jgi:hypothetical protein
MMTTWFPRQIMTATAVVFSASVAAAGNLHPIVEVESGYFFGATRNGKWIEAKDAAKSVQESTVFRVYSLTEQVGQAKGSKPKSVDEPCPDAMEVSLSPKLNRGVIALAAPWNALVRKVRTADTTQPVYIQAVRDFLKSRRIKEPKVKIKQILRVDLEGDGEDEILISATNYFMKDDSAPMSAPPPDSYSFVMLRRVVAGKVQTQFVAGEFHPRPTDSSAPNVYSIRAVLDLDGDGKLEVIVHSFYYEGGSTTIYRCEPARVKPLLAVECGV